MQSQHAYLAENITPYATSMRPQDYQNEEIAGLVLLDMDINRQEETIALSEWFQADDVGSAGHVNHGLVATGAREKARRRSLEFIFTASGVTYQNWSLVSVCRR